MNGAPLPFIAAEDLRKSYGALHAVDGVSLELRRGETYGLVGESGCGKSTLVKLFLGLDEPDSGRVLIEGKDRSSLGAVERKALRRRMQVVFQDPMSSLNPYLDVGRIVSEPLTVHSALSRKELRETAGQLLRKVGLAGSDIDRYPYEFSGGQCQRIAIARALSVNPELLICDEPLSSLDVSVQAQILNLLRDLKEEFNITCLFVAHNLAAVRWISDRVGVMKAGRIVEEGQVEDVFCRPKQPYTKALLASMPNPSKRR
jgi:ABC-type oligopeptide transport system ATPase subunit